MSDNNELVRLYLAYRAERARIKAQQRVELEAKLLPFARALGAEIVAQRVTQRIEDIMYTIGLKNKTFVYKMIDAYQSKVKPKPEPEVEELPEAEVEPEKPTYTIAETAPGEFLVNIGGYFVVFETDEYGKISKLPDSWVGGTKEERALYREIIQKIEK